MLRVYHSNRLDVLEALMEYIVEQERLDDPFEPEMVLVQSTGMAQWLQMSLSQKFGIAANIDFPLPASFIWEMFVRVLPDIPEQSAFNKQSMARKLMTLLPDMLAHDEFAMLRHYLNDDTDKRKLFQLASRTADLYDQYLVYRAEWLIRWEAGELVDGLPEAQIWQAPLWKALVEHTGKLGQPKWHRANLYDRFISILENSAERPTRLPSRVFICGISALPPVYLNALKALGKHTDIHILFTNPCRHYWGIFRIRAGYHGWSPVRENASLRNAPCRCLKTVKMRRSFLMKRGFRTCRTRCLPRGASSDATIFICFLKSPPREKGMWMRLRILRRTACCTIFSLIFWIWKTVPLPGSLPKSLREAIRSEN